MTGEFGKFIEKKRKESNKTLRGLATELDIAPAYMSDIEKGHRYPPDKEKLDVIVKVLSLSKKEADLMYDLAAREKENSVSPDLPEYIMNNDMARVALRIARDKKASEETWQRIIDLLESEG